jgi:uncharacterized protein
MQPDTAFRWFIEYGGRFDTGWTNQVTQVIPRVPVDFDPGLCVPHLKAPLLMIIAREDEMPYVSSDIARRVYDLAPAPKQLRQIDGGHFGLLHYPSGQPSAGGFPSGAPQVKRSAATPTPRGTPASPATSPATPP